jgi:hypothetical protein
MPNPVAANDLSPISGSLQTSRISYGVETSGKNYGQNYNSATWYSDIPNNGQFYTIISDNYTANYYVSRSNAEGAYVEGGLPAVDEYSAPVFWVTAGTSSLDVITTVNGLPDRIGQVPFNSGSQALNWIASSSNYFAVGPDYYAQIDADNLRLYLDANQVISYPTTQSKWYDLSGYSNNGTLFNGPSFNSTSGSIVFDGVDDYVNCGDIRFGTGSFTFEAWFNMSSAAAGYKWVMGKQGFNMGITINGTTLYFFLYDSSGNLYAPGSGISANTWYQAIGVYNGSSVILYINGVNTVSQALTNTPRNYDTLPLYLGTPDAGSLFFIGQIAKSRFYPKALSASDVAQNYYGGPIVTNDLSFMLDAGNLVSYPKSGTTAYDLTGNTNAALRNGTGFSSNDGGAWVLDGVNDFLELVSSITPGNGNWTLSAWVRGFGGVVGNTSGGPVTSGFGIFSSGGYKIFYANYDGVWNYNYGNTTLNPNEWYFLTWVNYDSQQMKMYVNGGADSSLFNSLTSNGGPVDAVGGTQGTPGGTFNGNIASVQWNIGTAFTDAQVLQNYNATK